MWTYLVAALGLSLILAMLWVMQPYFVWRKSQAKNQAESGKITIISTSG